MTEHVWALSLWLIGFCKNKLFCIIFAFFKGTKNREPISEQKLKNCENLWMVTIFAHFTNYFFHIGQRWKTCPKSPKISVDDFFWPMADFFLYVTCYVFIQNHYPQRWMTENVVLKIMNRTKKSPRIVNFHDCRIFYKLSCSRRPALALGATLSQFVENSWSRFFVAACRLPSAACRVHIFAFSHMFDMFRVHKICSSKSDNDRRRS